MPQLSTHKYSLKHLPKRQEIFLQLVNYIGNKLEKEYVDAGNKPPEDLPDGVTFVQYALARQLLQIAMHKSAANMSNDEKELACRAVEIIYDRLYPKLQAIDTTVALEAEQVVQLANRIVDVVADTIPPGELRNKAINRIAGYLEEMNAPRS